MEEIIKKLNVLLMSVDSVVHNNKYKHPDKEAQSLGDKLIAERFSSQITEIITCLQNSHSSTSSSSQSQSLTSGSESESAPSLVINVDAKCNDCCFVSTNTGLEHDGYVPRNLGIGGGDYVSLSLDAATGRIIGFKPLTEEQISAILNK